MERHGDDTEVGQAGADDVVGVNECDEAVGEGLCVREERSKLTFVHLVREVPCGRNPVGLTMSSNTRGSPFLWSITICPLQLEL